MEAPSYPEHIDEALRAIRPTLRLVWNPRAVVVKPGSFDAAGHSREPVYGGRFELWDTDSEGRDYRVMILRHTDDAYREPGQWLIEHLHYVDPARWGGRIDNMLRALDERSARLREISDRDWDDFVSYVTKSWIEFARRPSVPTAGVPL